ncbi:MAG TPA: hypothetical protein VHE55_08750 [Fimbriimonadaceae bacterium]|nr:hypothetical protein [Fimbriimonadaceae bacterium]
MGRIFALTMAALTCCAAAFSPVQQGQMGRINSEDSLAGLERALGTYLNGDEIKSVLTPNEFNEWPLTLKAGQVILAEARSDAFDPALEIVDDKGKVLAYNDDRYPGDQRPLLMWRCEQDGAYALHVRCFHDKSGGQFFMRFRTWDSVAVSTDGLVEKEVPKDTEFLLKVHMKAGEIAQPISDVSDKKYSPFTTRGVIAPGGLPDVDLARAINPVVNGFMAAAEGDYYILAQAYGDRPKALVHAGVRDIVADALTKEGAGYVAKGKTNQPMLWHMSVKAGELIEVSAPELNLNPRFVLAEIPDISNYVLDPKKPEQNPFFPQPKEKAPANKGPVYDILPGRARDNRLFVFFVRRDANMWLATDGQGRPGIEYTLHVQPAAADYSTTAANSGKLRVGNYDYWYFDAQAGDVMTFKSNCPDFAQQVVVRAPDLGVVRNATADTDQEAETWNMVVQQPGRYFMTVSCLGDGGGGPYSLSRTVYHPKEFGKGSPAQSEIAPGQVQVWKFTAKPGRPLYMHWKSTGSYSVSVFDAQGRATSFQRTMVDPGNSFGIISVTEPTTYLIVLTAEGTKGSYSIELSDLPGYGKG